MDLAAGSNFGPQIKGFYAVKHNVSSVLRDLNSFYCGSLGYRLVLIRIFFHVEIDHKLIEYGTNLGLKKINVPPFSPNF